MLGLNKQEKRTALLGIIAFFLLVGYILTRFPAAQRWLIRRDHRQVTLGYDPGVMYHDWGWGTRSQLHNADLGPMLLGDSEVVERHLAQLGSADRPEETAGEWALMFAALRLQGKTNAEILARQDGLTLTVATLVAEADPPAWWRRAIWLAKATKAQPQGSFRLGLLGPADIEALMARLKDCWKLEQLSCYVHAILRHDSGFTLAQRERVLEAWMKGQEQFFNANNKASVEAALSARAGLARLLSDKVQPGGEVTLQLAYPPHVGALERKRLAWTLSDFIRSLGYRPRVVSEGAQAALEIQLAPVNFSQVTVDHYEPYTTTERVRREVYGGKYNPRQTVWEDQTVTRNERVSELGASDIVSWVVTIQLGTEAVSMALPPYGGVSKDTQVEIAGYLKDFSKVSAFNWSYYLTNDATRPWRFGLDAFYYEWELEELQ